MQVSAAFENFVCNAGGVNLVDVKVKSHDYLILITSGIMQRCIALGFQDAKSIGTVQALDAMCAAWIALLQPKFYKKVSSYTRDCW